MRTATETSPARALEADAAPSSQRVTAKRRAVLAFAGSALLVALATSGQSARYDKAPEFPSQDPKEWIGPPQSLKALAGKVVILDVWTFG